MTDHAVHVPVTWIADHTGYERLHNLGDALHEQETAMDRNRYFWSVYPSEPIIFCRDNTSHYVVEWREPDGDEIWIIPWLREMTKLAARKAMH
jgi:hypothetical protein